MLTFLYYTYIGICRPQPICSFVKAIELTAVVPLPANLRQSPAITDALIWLDDIYFDRYNADRAIVLQVCQIRGNRAAHWSNQTPTIPEWIPVHTTCQTWGYLSSHQFWWPSYFYYSNGWSFVLNSPALHPFMADIKRHHGQPSGRALTPVPWVEAIHFTRYGLSFTQSRNTKHQYVISNSICSI